MKMNIFKHEFKMNLKSVISWSAAVAALLFIFISLFSSFAEEAELLNEMLTEFPEELLLAFAANYGFSLVSIEERELTADFLLAKPVGRTQIMTSKLLAALSGLTITNIVIWISSFVFIQMFKGDRTYDTRSLFLLLLSILVFQLFFLTVGLVISLLVKRVRSVTPYAMALVFGMYVLSAFGDMLGESMFENITPFKHFEPSYIVQHAAYNLPLVSISLVVIVISLLGSYLLYSRRNIPSVV